MSKLLKKSRTNFCNFYKWPDLISLATYDKKIVFDPRIPQYKQVFELRSLKSALTVDF